MAKHTTVWSRQIWRLWSAFHQMEQLVILTIAHALPTLSWYFEVHQGNCLVVFLSFPSDRLGEKKQLVCRTVEVTCSSLELLSRFRNPTTSMVSFSVYSAIKRRTPHSRWPISNLTTSHTILQRAFSWANIRQMMIWQGVDLLDSAWADKAVLSAKIVNLRTFLLLKRVQSNQDLTRDSATELKEKSESRTAWNSLPETRPEEALKS